MLYKFSKVADSEGNIYDCSAGTGNCCSLGNLINSEQEKGIVRIRPYSETEGFHEVNNPGWIKFQLEKESIVSYIRFHLWDSCGNGKQQPSHRKYQYRLLVTDAKDPMDKSARWTVIFDTMSNGSNGWQEFYKEGAEGFGKLTGIMVHTMNNSRNDRTQFLEMHASQYPTKSIAEELGLENIATDDLAPTVHRIISNRVICGSDHEAHLTQDIFGEVREKLRALEQELNLVATDSQNSLPLKELTHEDNLKPELNTIDTEIKHLASAIIRPVNDEFVSQRQTEKHLKIASVITFILAITTMAFDIYTLWTGK